MLPVVNELENIFYDQVEFRYLDANGDGKDAFRTYHLRGHPGYILLNPSGEVLWSGLGEQPKTSLEDALQTGLSK